MKKLFNSFLLLMMVIALAAGCSKEPDKTAAPEEKASTEAKTEAPPQVLTIGEIETLTGHSSDNLKLAADGGKMAMEYINNRGGITVNGQKYMIEILLEDNKGNPDGAAAAANKLVYDKKVKFIAGGAQVSSTWPLPRSPNRPACCMSPNSTTAPRQS